MTLEEQITELLVQAAPLRLLAGDDPEAEPLAGIVDKINALRAEQAKAGPVAVVAKVADEPVRKKPGPKPKGTVEGADAVL
jgi:hypothetical protein